MVGYLAFAGISDLQRDRIAFDGIIAAVARQGRTVEIHVLAAIQRDKAELLLNVEKFHFADKQRIAPVCSEAKMPQSGGNG